jgi:hypothetical protein
MLRRPASTPIGAVEQCVADGAVEQPFGHWLLNRARPQNAVVRHPETFTWESEIDIVTTSIPNTDGGVTRIALFRVSKNALGSCLIEKQLAHGRTSVDVG